MLEKLIHWSLKNVMLVLIFSLLLLGAGLFALFKAPLDAIPDLSDVQVIVTADYPGQSPQVVEDQVSYPLVSAMLAVPKSRVVRGFSFFGTSFVYVIFEDGTDPYWARSRVLEYLNVAAGKLPPGVTPTLGADSSGVGWVYQYALQSKNLNLAEQRSTQDWFLRQQLSKAPGVAEVASVGGFVQQYQVTVDPQQLRKHGLSLQSVSEAIRRSNLDVGARSIEMAETEYMVRGQGYLKSVDDLRRIVLKSQSGITVLLQDVARIELGPDERRGIAELNGEGEVVGGIAMARFGENARVVIQNIKKRLVELQPALPAGLSIVPVYDRSELIDRAIKTLTSTLFEESLIVAVVCGLFLLHARSALVAIIVLPLGVLGAFILMRWFGVNSNIMSLGGLAIALGAMVDAAIVMVENAHKHLERAAPETPRTEVIFNACREVGPALFFSLLIITVSFLPVFTLEAQEGRLFAPLALTKTFAMAVAALLSVTLVPVLMLLLVRGRILPERKNPLNRLLIAIYRPCINAALNWKKTSIVLALAVLLVSFWPLARLGVEFMPSLNEGSLLFMPTAQPGISVTRAGQLMQTQNALIKQFPEVESVFGKAGRANTASDPAPMEMFETVVNLKPQSQWRPGMTLDKLIAELDQSVQIPGVANSWTMPIKARIDMISTGIRTPIGIKLFGSDSKQLEQLARQVETAVKAVPGTTSAYAERLSGAMYLSIVPDRGQLARYGLVMADVQEVIMAALGGDMVTNTVEGRQRLGVLVRYPRAMRSDPESIGRDVLIPTSDGAMIPLGQLAQIKIESGSPGIRTENGLLAAYIYVDIRDRDIATYVNDARQAVLRDVKFPPGYYAVWSGQFESMQRAMDKLEWVLPATLALIFLLLYLNFRRLSPTLMVMLSLPFSLCGGVWLLWVLDYNLSVAVAVGFIALAGVAAETGVMMLVYLDQAWNAVRAECERIGRQPNRGDLYQAIMAGAADRLRPKMMTVLAISASLLPIMWSQGTGSEVMRRIAAPMLGGMASSTLLTLLVIPVIYALVQGWRLGSEDVSKVCT